MTNKYYTSLKLSKLLKKNGCELICSKIWVNKKLYGCEDDEKGIDIDEHCFRAYHILWDICVKYVREFFGEGEVCGKCNPYKLKPQCKDETNFRSCEGVQPIEAYKFFSLGIFTMLQQNKPQEEIEEYIWKNCVFNPNNKEERC